MKSFLEHIAAHIIKSYNERIEKQCIIFPNRRAGIFFKKYLTSKIDKPLWSPEIKTINELFGLFSDLRIAENELLVFELYNEYSKLVQKSESFDSFYFWGEMLLNDFDDVDKYLVNAENIFTNLSDLKNIDQKFGELTEEQIKILQQFWRNFNAGSSTDEKKDFINTWNILKDLYKNFRKNLSDKRLAYEGMIFREVAEKCLSGTFPVPEEWETFHFVGFNALNKCEKTLFHYLKKNNRAKFYWDYDEVYINNSDHSAGFFIRANLSEFGNDMPDDWNYRTLLSEPTAGNVKKKIINTTSDVSQVKLIPDLLEEFGHSDNKDASDTAIILADENLLIPLITSIPDNVGDVNITMGYPLRFSPIYSFVKNLLSLQKNSRNENGKILFAFNDVAKILNHSFLSDEEQYKSRTILSSAQSKGKPWIQQEELCLTPELNIIFRRIESQTEIPLYLKNVLESQYIIGGDKNESELNTKDLLHNEFLFRTLQVLNRLEMIISASKIDMNIPTWARLFDNIIRNLSVPFTGEPLSGLQIMGLLETRVLDFKNIIMLSVNEEILPRSSGSLSYLPWSLREAFGLPVLRHQDSVYSYYFYRLLHRAENVVFIFNSNDDGLRTGEMSRFLLQLRYLYENPPQISSSGYEIGAKIPFPEITERNENHQKILEEKYLNSKDTVFSPAAINAWLTCRMKFYYKYICDIKEPDKIFEGIDPASFGIMLHKVMEKIYSPYIGRTVDKNTISRISANSNIISGKIKELIIETFHPLTNEKLSGSEQIAANILEQYIKMILDKDAKSTPLIIESLEKLFDTQLSFGNSGNSNTIKIGGVIDRIDRVNNSLRIIDYKTGDIIPKIKSLEELFDEIKKDRAKEWLQLLIYCEILYSQSQYREENIYPVIYTVRKLTDLDYSGTLVIKQNQGEMNIDNYKSIREPFIELLRNLVKKIFDPKEPFKMTENKYICRYCPYINLCRRF